MIAHKVKTFYFIFVSLALAVHIRCLGNRLKSIRLYGEFSKQMIIINYDFHFFTSLHPNVQYDDELCLSPIEKMFPCRCGWMNGCGCEKCGIVLFATFLSTSLFKTEMKRTEYWRRAWIDDKTDLLSLHWVARGRCTAYAVNVSETQICSVHSSNTVIYIHLCIKLNATQCTNT